MRLCILILFVALRAIAGAQDMPLADEELSKFLGPVSPRLISWTVTGGPDFAVFHGRANPPLSGTVGFYLGGAPSFKPEPGSTIVKGRLGIFPLKWYRKVGDDGPVTQRALVDLDYSWKADVWVVAARQSDVDQLVAILSQLPTFTKKPKRTPGMPQTALEYYARPITAIAVFLTFLAVLVPTGLLLHRRWRRVQISLAHRLFLLSAYVGCAMIVVAGIGIGSAWMLLSIFSQRDSAQGIFLGSASIVLVAAICLIVLLGAGIVVRLRSGLLSA